MSTGMIAGLTGAGNSAAPADQNLGQQFGSIVQSAPQLIGMGENAASWQANTLYPDMAKQQRAATTAQVQNAAGNVANLGPQAQAAISQLAPGWQEALGAVNSQVAGGNTMAQTGAYQSLNNEAGAANTAPIQSQLSQQASSELGMGGSLSPDQQRLVTQSTQQGFADRGMAMSNPAMFSNALNLDQYSQQQQQQRQGFAENVAGQQQQLQGQAQQMNQQNENSWNAELGSAEGMNQGSLGPVMGVLGQQAASAASAASLMGAGTSAVSLPTGYAENMYSTDYSGQAAALQTSAKDETTLLGGSSGGAGGAANGLGSLASLAMC